MGWFFGWRVSIAIKTGTLVEKLFGTAKNTENFQLIYKFIFLHYNLLKRYVVAKVISSILFCQNTPPYVVVEKSGKK